MSATSDDTPAKADAAWHELPFVDGDDNWAPPTIPGDDENSWTARWELGSVYAWAFVNHLRRYRHIDQRECLHEIIEAMIKRGPLGEIECGFLQGLASIITRDRVNIGGYDAKGLEHTDGWPT